MMIGLLNFLVLILLSVGFGFIARRVLGVPVGWPRSIIVGFLLFTSIDTITTSVAEERGGRLEFITEEWNVALVVVMIFFLILAWAFFLGIAALVVLELIIPTGSLPTPWGLVRDARQRFRRTRRYLQVMVIATRNGLGGFIGSSTSAAQQGSATNSSATARALCNALNEGGVTFIKIGQMLSTRPDLIGPVYARELSALQATTTPVDWSQLEAVLTTAQDRPLAEIFSDISSEPLAVASVAQVHTATLVTGEPVVVKIQKPNAHNQVAADLDIVMRLARRIERSTQWGKSLGVVGMAEGFAASLREELDYRVEIDNTLAIAGATPPDSGIHIPHVYTELSGSRVMVLERLSGVPLGKAGDQLATLSIEDRKVLADHLLGAVMRQVMVGGIFHADMHPGNVLLGPEQELQLLDFGSVGRLDDGAREALVMLILAIDRGSSLSATDALMVLMDPPADPVDERMLEREIGQLLVRFRAGTQNTAGMFSSLFLLVNRYGFGVPAQIAAVFRTFAALEGTLRLIDPDLNLVVSARKHGEALFTVTPTSIREQIEAEALNLLPILRRLPRRLDKITMDLEQGRTSISVRLLEAPEDRQFLVGLTHQVVVALLASAVTVAAILLLGAQGGPQLMPSVALYQLLGYGFLFIGCVLGLRAIILVFRRT
jgi:ubiquinone biosynthesis protein